MKTTVSEFFGVLTAAFVVAGLAVVVARGGDTAKILGAAGDSFANIIKAATLRGTPFEGNAQ
jgi:hypothetical protein